MQYELSIRPGVFRVAGKVHSKRATWRTAIWCRFFDECGAQIGGDVEGLRECEIGHFRVVEASSSSVSFNIHAYAPHGAVRLALRVTDYDDPGASIDFSHGPFFYPDPDGAPVRFVKGRTLDAGFFEPGKSIVLEVDVDQQSGDHERAYVLVVTQFDSNGDQLTGRLEGLAHSDKIGAYLYAEFLGSERSRSLKVPIQAQPNAVRYEIQIRPWRSRADPIARITSRKEILEPSAQMSIVSARLQRFLSASRHNERGVVLITATTKELETANRLNRPQIAAQTFSSLGYAVIYVYFRHGPHDGLATVEHNGIIQIPIDVFGQLATNIASAEVKGAKIAIFSMPDYTACRSLGLFNFFGWSTVYEIRDDWEEFAAAGVGKWYRASMERFLVRNAQQVVTVSTTLLDKAKLFSRDLTAGIVSPNATTSTFIEVSRPYSEDRARQPTENPTPRIGYFGHLTDTWFDWPLMLSAATARPDWNFELIGFGAPELNFLPANVKIIEAVHQLALPHLTRHWDVAVIPFVHSPLARSVDPIKVYDYLALNLPVVSSEMGNLSKMPGCYVYRSPAEFIPAVEQAFTEYARAARRIDFEPEQNVWEVRLQDLLTKVLDKDLATA